MSKSRKRAGTATATKSPPAKKTRARGSSGTEGTTGKARATGSTSKPATGKKSGSAAGSASVQGTAGQGAKGGAASAKGEASTKRKKGGAAKKGAATEDEALEQEGFALVDSDAEQSGGEEGAPSEGGTELNAVAQLEAMKKRWTSTIYAFYEPTPEIQYEGSRRSHVFKCMKRSCDVTVRRFLDTKDHSSTSNLRAHANKCWGTETVAAAAEAASVQVARDEIVGSILKTGSITAHFERKAGQVTYSARQHNRTETRVEIVRWVCESLRAFRIVEDPGFKVLMKTGRPGYYLPSASTVARDVTEVFQRTRSRIAKMLQEHEGALHFATDAWTSPNHRAFVAVTVHFEQQGKPICFLLDIVEVACSHTGINLAAAFTKILKEFGIEHKIKGVTCDNASNNDTMIEALGTEENLPAFDGVAAHVRCFLHILNIVGGTNLVNHFDTRAQKKKGQPDAGDDPEIAELGGQARAKDVVEEVDDDGSPHANEADEEDVDDGNAEPEYDVDGEEEVDATAEMTAAEKAEFAEAVLPVKLLLAKIRTFAFKVVNSSTILLPAWKECVATHGLPERLIPRDVRTRWNSTYDMLEMVLEYQKPYKKMCERTDNGLRAYELSVEEWQVARQLEKVLKVFKHATVFFSRATPNLAQVIPVMDHIDKVLTNASRSDKYDKAIRVACGLAKEALNKYYSYTDMSDTYRIAMMLHPTHKLDYFKTLKWPAGWQKTARELLVEEYERSYKDSGSVDDPSDEDEDDKDNDNDEDDEDGPNDPHERKSNTSRSRSSSGAEESDDELDFSDEENMFDALRSLTRLRVSKKGDELTRYLAIPIEDTDDPLAWWAERRALYPRLSRMALDYLTTSVDVERVFSKGRLLLSHVRSRMNAQTTRAVLCVGAWSRAGYVKAADLRKAAQTADLDNDEHGFQLVPGWDRIDVNVDRS
ncbi:hypothetical protein GSI_12002 [Ganoderma sinense ZZ0214-1]|uniref:HAT C-terminal dimerisation domain-containing protein n=1 Tax=Ganoderma sinense ZZ0214-1 TaxID=1077348 RepID=A0A2G8RXK5_9APHY|nr:hypothetical protein GSI_12002 [Ganoderma sinense ZZ0214-1]